MNWSQDLTRVEFPFRFLFIGITSFLSFGRQNKNFVLGLGLYFILLAAKVVVVSYVSSFFYYY